VIPLSVRTALQFALYGRRNAPFPVYVPAEMLLIKTEAEAQVNGLPSAMTDINAMRTKSGTANTPGAQLPALTVASLDTEGQGTGADGERRYELFSQRLRWEDLRQLGTFIGMEPKVDFLSMSRNECNTNRNVSC
jgi:hypothetical protein